MADGSAPPPEKPAEHSGVATFPIDYLRDELADAERILSYAARVGISIDQTSRDAILTARAAREQHLSHEAANKLLAALTTLADQIKPVTLESLRVCSDHKKARSTITEYVTIAVVLIAFIVPCSLVSLISAPLSERIGKEIDSANQLALKLNGELLTPPRPAAADAEIPKPPYNVSEQEALADLQHFASAIRVLDQCATKLNLFVIYSVEDPFAELRTRPSGSTRSLIDDKFELPVPPSDLPAIAKEKIVVYQSVRYFAQKVQSTVTAWFGAVSGCILPSLYAMLGACAYLLRSLEEQLKRRTFVGDRHGARFLIAAIGGLVVGLFADSFQIGEAPKLPPLGIAFLVGYAVDVFFSFLENLLEMFRRTSAPPPADAAKKSSANT